MKTNKFNQLKENFFNSENGYTFREYVEIESQNDPNFFRWFFDEEFDEDYDLSLSAEQKDEFKEFLSSLPGYYTIVYDSPSMEAIHYSFESDCKENAYQYAKSKIGDVPFKLIQNDASDDSDNGDVIYNSYDE